MSTQTATPAPLWISKLGFESLHPSQNTRLRPVDYESTGRICFSGDIMTLRLTLSHTTMEVTQL
jgi:hypothetical protein